MNLGFVSAILPDLTLEELTTYASSRGFGCIEVCCWPVGKAERRYAGVTHIDVDMLDAEKIKRIQNMFRDKGLEISALGYYPNPLDPDEEKSMFYVSHIKKVIEASARLGIHQINTFIGRDKQKTVEENFERFVAVWKPLIAFAASANVKVGIENCPMIFTHDEWPGGNNLATTPAIWRRMFAEIPDANFGLNYDPSHLLWMQMDYVRPVYEFHSRFFHVHLKDAHVFRDKLNDVGIMAYPLEFHSPKIPGMGDIDWARFISALHDVRYEGPLCIEVEDKAFESSLESRKAALEQSRRFIMQYL